MSDGHTTKYHRRQDKNMVIGVEMIKGKFFPVKEGKQLRKLVEIRRA